MTEKLKKDLELLFEAYQKRDFPIQSGLVNAAIDTIDQLEQDKRQLINHVEFLREEYKKIKTQQIEFQNKYISGQLMNQEPPEGMIYFNPELVADDCLWMAETCGYRGDILPEIKIPE